MAGPRQATAVVTAKGKKHLTKAETAARLAAEERALGGDEGDKGSFQAPRWLPASLREDFRALRAELVRRGLMVKMDRDMLGFFLVAREEYVACARRASAAIERGDLDGASEWSSIQDRYFKQARGAANDMGLTVTSRLRLALPEPPEQQSDNAFLRLLESRQRRA